MFAVQQTGLDWTQNRDIGCQVSIFPATGQKLSPGRTNLWPSKISDKCVGSTSKSGLDRSITPASPLLHSPCVGTSARLVLLHKKPLSNIVTIVSLTATPITCSTTTFACRSRPQFPYNAPTTPQASRVQPRNARHNPAPAAASAHGGRQRRLRSLDRDCRDPAACECRIIHDASLLSNLSADMPQKSQPLPSLQGEQGAMSLRGGDGGHGGIGCRKTICGIDCYWGKKCC